MQINNLKYLLVITGYLLTAFWSAPHCMDESRHLECTGDCRLSPGAIPVGKHRNHVERAGVILLKDYGKDLKDKPNSRYVVIIGHGSRHENSRCNFFAGKCDSSDQYTTVTAIRELKEETGGSITLTAEQLRKQPFIYYKKKQLFFWRDDALNVDRITKDCKEACQNKELSRSLREVNEAVEIPVSELINAALHINKENNEKKYILITRSGNNVDIDGHYMRIIVNQCDMVKKILNNMFPDANF